MIDEELESQKIESSGREPVEVVIPRSENISTKVLEFRNFMNCPPDNDLSLSKDKVMAIINKTKGSDFKEVSNKLDKAARVMAADFERNKKANEYSRTSVSISGSLNTRALHKYKISDEIFKTVETLKEGKSHGVQLLIDFSGSMQGNRIKDVINQTFLLVKFCRIVKIPYEVFAFAHVTGKLTETNPRHVLGTAVCDSSELVKISDNNMSQSDSDDAFLIAMCRLEVLGGMTCSDYYQAFRLIEFGYSATPLADSILQMLPLSQKFKSVNNVQHTSIIIFTDGGDTSGMSYCVGGFGGQLSYRTIRAFGHFANQYTLLDAETGIEYSPSRVGETRTSYSHINITVVESLLSLLATRTESSVTYIKMGKSSAINGYMDFSKQYKKEFTAVGMFQYEPITEFKMVIMKDTLNKPRPRSDWELTINPYENNKGEITVSSAKSAFRSQSKDNRKVKAFSNIIIDSICSNF